MSFHLSQRFYTPRHTPRISTTSRRRCNSAAPSPVNSRCNPAGATANTPRPGFAMSGNHAVVIGNLASKSIRSKNPRFWFKTAASAGENIRAPKGKEISTGHGCDVVYATTASRAVVPIA